MAENKNPIDRSYLRWRWSQIGAAAALLGDTTKAQAMVENVRQKAATFTRGFADYREYGFPNYEEAVIQAHLGQKGKAVALLQDAIQQSKAFGAEHFKYDPFLFPLLGYPPFEELVKPKG